MNSQYEAPKTIQDWMAGFNEMGRTQPPAQTGQAGQFSGMQRWLGGTADNGAQTNGYLPTAMGVGTGLLQGYLGMKKYGLAKDQFKQNRKEFKLNYDAQQQMTNTQLEDRQRARVRGNPDAYESVSSYMDRNRVRDR